MPRTKKSTKNSTQTIVRPAKTAKAAKVAKSPKAPAKVIHGKTVKAAAPAVSIPTAEQILNEYNLPPVAAKSAVAKKK